MERMGFTYAQPVMLEGMLVTSRRLFFNTREGFTGNTSTGPSDNSLLIPKLPKMETVGVPSISSSKSAIIRIVLGMVGRGV